MIGRVKSTQPYSAHIHQVRLNTLAQSHFKWQRGRKLGVCVCVCVCFMAKKSVVYGQKIDAIWYILLEISTHLLYTCIYTVCTWIKRESVCVCVH